MKQDEENRIDQLRETCEQLAKIIDNGEQYREPEYQKLFALLCNVRSVADQLRVSDLSFAPRQSVNAIFEGLNNIVINLRTFELSDGPTPLPVRIERCITNVEERYLAIYGAAITVLMDNLVLHSERGEDSLSSLVVHAQSVLDRTTAKCDETVKRCQQALENVTEMYQKAGIEARAANFKDQADSHCNAAKIWLGFGFATALGIVFYLCVWFEPALVKDAAQEMRIFIALSLSKLVIVSLSTFLLVVCFRNYSANKHNEVVYRGKQVALSTFEQFVKGASDEATKNAILTHACQSIFNSQTSGYLRNEPEPAHGNQIIEIVRSIAGGKS